MYPNTYTAVVLMVVALCVRAGVCQDAMITLHPQPKNTTFRSIDTFTCSGVGDNLIWIINGHFSESTNPALDPLEINVAVTDPPSPLFSTLTLRSSTEESITVQCVAISLLGANDLSNEVIVLVQGILEPVSQLTSQYHNNFNQILNWTAPPTLDLTDFDPDINYTVCNNATNTCVITANTTHVFPTTCFSIEYNVSACNPAGCSDAEVIMIVYESVQDPTMIDHINSEFFYSSEDLIVEFIFQTNGNCTGIYRANFTGTYDSTNVISPDQPLLPTVDENGNHRVTLTESDGVVPNEEFTGSCGMDHMSTSQPPSMICPNFTTFDVQRTTVSAGGGAIDVTCKFARGSSARGCRAFVLSFSPSVLSPHPMDAIRMNTESNKLASTASVRFTRLQISRYLVFVADIEDDESITCENCQLYSKRLTITDAPPITPPSSTVAAVPVPTASRVPTGPPTSPEDDSSDSQDQTVVFAAFGASMLVFLVLTSTLTAIAVIFIVHKKKKSARIVLKENAAYETVVTRQRKQQNTFQMEPCPAYEKVTR